MKNNIFENAYFGKAFKTRDGRKAIYFFYTKNNKWHELIIEGETITLPYHDNGLMFGNVKGSEWDEDIISEWQEEPVNLSLVENGQLILECIKRRIYISKKNKINEEELDKLANNTIKELEQLGCEFTAQERSIMNGIYKAGYRKANNE